MDGSAEVHTAPILLPPLRKPRPEAPLQLPRRLLHAHVQLRPLPALNPRRHPPAAAQDRPGAVVGPVVGPGRVAAAVGGDEDEAVEAGEVEVEDGAELSTEHLQAEGGWQGGGRP